MVVPPNKKSRIPDLKLPSSLLIKFIKFDGSEAGNGIDIPISATIENLGALLNEILGNTDKVASFLLTI